MDYTDHVLIANITTQRLAHFHKARTLKVYLMSSSKKQQSCIENSLGTPWGLHVVCEKIGTGQPQGMVFEGRVPIGLKADQCSVEKQKNNLITTRILRLSGLEEKVNKGGIVDSYKRYIYIHGTNHEQNLGTPVSSGCLQLSNENIQDVFDMIEVGTQLYIERPSKLV